MGSRSSKAMFRSCWFPTGNMPPSPSPPKPTMPIRPHPCATVMLSSLPTGAMGDESTMDMKITDILAPSCIKIGLEVTDKEDVLVKLVDTLNAAGQVKNRDELLQVIMEREKLMSTGIGHGVALPHGKTNVVDSSIAALATLQNPIDFDALDDKPVSIVLLLVGTEGNVSIHLRLLSRISRMIGSDQFRSALIASRTPEEVLDLFASYEEERA
ncbi:MAG: PTS sugar transporter subunit IIA [Ignavibacteriae bacterium]|nr:MAG: PTS sugar transporter subunit IIA [Ignavibacteriota bacterium]